MTKHTITIVGVYPSTCYLDVSEEEAVRRYKETNPKSTGELIPDTTAFNDEFNACIVTTDDDYEIAIYTNDDTNK